MPRVSNHEAVERAVMIPAGRSRTDWMLLPSSAGRYFAGGAI